MFHYQVGVGCPTVPSLNWGRGSHYWEDEPFRVSLLTHNCDIIITDEVGGRERQVSVEGGTTLLSNTLNSVMV